eukprot:gnl/TRDRNA2_/TRDRNA2_34520_c0_seq1.p1 gnl/TRDRNA2_/TRDRNA2_34520_c0~~gnl/TRDRNA2_/TRDRNA2_34520_c0_seq1.p1  ORF type:complete len:621 (-),score=107.37 gnl/TRDRNA2_/TRDRNA2_34520_c0_seq1:47-1885(-)
MWHGGNLPTPASGAPSEAWQSGHDVLGSSRTAGLPPPPTRPVPGTEVPQPQLPPALLEHARNVFRWFPEVFFALGAPNLEEDFVPSKATLCDDPDGRRIKIALRRQGASASVPGCSAVDGAAVQHWKMRVAAALVAAERGIAEMRLGTRSAAKAACSQPQLAGESSVSPQQKVPCSVDSYAASLAGCTPNPAPFHLAARCLEMQQQRQPPAPPAPSAVKPSSASMLGCDPNPAPFPLAVNHCHLQPAARQNQLHHQTTISDNAKVLSSLDSLVDNLTALSTRFASLDAERQQQAVDIPLAGRLAAEKDGIAASPPSSTPASAKSGSARRAGGRVVRRGARTPTNPNSTGSAALRPESTTGQGVASEVDVGASGRRRATTDATIVTRPGAAASAPRRTFRLGRSLTQESYGTGEGSAGASSPERRLDGPAIPSPIQPRSPQSSDAGGECWSIHDVDPDRNGEQEGAEEADGRRWQSSPPRCPVEAPAQLVAAGASVPASGAGEGMDLSLTDLKEMDDSSMAEWLRKSAQQVTNSLQVRQQAQQGLEAVKAAKEEDVSEMRFDPPQRPQKADKAGTGSRQVPEHSDAKAQSMKKKSNDHFKEMIEHKMRRFFSK